MSRGGAWDGGPPGAESDYRPGSDAAYSRYPAPPPGASEPRYAGYEAARYKRSGGAASSTTYPAPAAYRSRRDASPPPRPSRREASPASRSSRRETSPAPRSSRREASPPPRSSRREASPAPRSRREASPAPRPPRREASPAPRAGAPRGRARAASSSSSSSGSASSASSSDRHRKKLKSPSSHNKHDRSKHSDKTRKVSPQRRSLEHSRTASKPPPLQNERSTPASVASKRTHKSRDSRDRSITPPRGFKRGPRASSSSSSSSRSSSSLSRSPSRSRSPASRHSSSAERKRPPRRARVRSHSPSPTPTPPGSPPKSRSRQRSRSDSDSSRGHFSGYDRKRYWRSLKEKKPKSPEQPVEEVAEVAPVEAPSAESEELEYRDPPPLPEGLNFEDLPPPPKELFTKPKKPSGPLCIRNDGSFLEMFKKMQEESSASGSAAPTTAVEVPKRPALPFIGKRRGGRVLKTGMVKKAKVMGERPADDKPKDAWSLYMEEVKKYRETSCEEERKTRPLVK